MDDPSLPVVAALMEVEEKDLRQWLCNKKVVARNDSYVTPLKPVEVNIVMITDSFNNLFVGSTFQRCSCQVHLFQLV